MSPLSPSLSLTGCNIPICKSQEISRSRARSSHWENAVHRPRSDVKPSRRTLLKDACLGLVGTGLSIGRPARAEPESPEQSSSSRMSYSRFLRYLDEGAVRKVDLFENGTVAIVEIESQALNRVRRVRVELPGLPKELVRKLKEKDVDFAAHPIEPNVGLMVLDFLTNFGFPLLLLGSLFLRTSSPRTPGVPNLPFGLRQTLSCR